MGKSIQIAELFAGVGGFRLGLDGYHDPAHPEYDKKPAGPFKTIWANQWEPAGSVVKQFAWRCYERHFGAGSCVNEDITKVLDQYENGERDIPDFDMLVGGFPCQDYSVARPLSQAGGIEGKKGVLWWQIYRMLQLKSPKYILLENVDRLLKSPASQRGRDFAIILACLDRLGYSAEWRVINAADYGMPQRRRRVYIYAVRDSDEWDTPSRLTDTGVIARAFPIDKATSGEPTSFSILDDPYQVSENFGLGAKISPFQSAGVMQNHRVTTAKVAALYDGPQMTLADVLVPDDDVPESFYISEESQPRWRYFKNAKKEDRQTSSGFHYVYSEGGMEFPDSVDKPSRTILTSEGGSGPSRMKHVVESSNGRLRRLVPDELDQLQMFPRGWTNTGMTDGHRAFCMGNALVVGIPHEIGKVIAEDFKQGRC